MSLCFVKTFFLGLYLQEAAEQQTPRPRQEDPRAVDQQVDFDLLGLRASLKRRREAAAADLLASQQGNKRLRFEAASLQVSLLSSASPVMLCIIAMNRSALLLHSP